MSEWRGRPGDVWKLKDGWAVVGPDGRFTSERFKSQADAESAGDAFAPAPGMHRSVCGQLISADEWREMERDARRDEYHRYLQTEAWQRKRTERLNIDGWKCCRCGSPHRLQVHHLNYDRVGNEDVHVDTATLCNDCHRIVHGLDGGTGETRSLRPSGVFGGSVVSRREPASETNGLKP